MVKFPESTGIDKKKNAEIGRYIRKRGGGGELKLKNKCNNFVIVIRV